MCPYSALYSTNSIYETISKIEFLIFKRAAQPLMFMCKFEELVHIQTVLSYQVCK